MLHFTFCEAVTISNGNSPERGLDIFRAIWPPCAPLLVVWDDQHISARLRPMEEGEQANVDTK